MTQYDYVEMSKFQKEYNRRKAVVLDKMDKNMNEKLEFEYHNCKGALTETWLTPCGREFWLLFNIEPQRCTWIEFCPYCGYRPHNLRKDWGKNKVIS